MSYRLVIQRGFLVFYYYLVLLSDERDYLGKTWRGKDKMDQMMDFSCALRMLMKCDVSLVVKNKCTPYRDVDVFVRLFHWRFQRTVNSSRVNINHNSFLFRISDCFVQWVWLFICKTINRRSSFILSMFTEFDDFIAFDVEHKVTKIVMNEFCAFWSNCFKLPRINFDINQNWKLAKLFQFTAFYIVINKKFWKLKQKK